MNAIDKLQAVGTSTWLDDLSRDRINSGNLRRVISDKSVVGVTTNPAIFAHAMSQGSAYDDQIAALKEQGMPADEAVYEMSIQDVRDACDIFRDIYLETQGKDGRVSIEVDPRISDDAAATLAQARTLWERVDRENLMIKIPATEGSLPAISAALAEGISVNVTLIFSVERYGQVIEAYIDGINAAYRNNLDVTKIHSVASFFVSRLDTEIDARLEDIGTPEALAMRGKAGIANARVAYALFADQFKSADMPAGAHIQRPLWASTGVKNPNYPATLYVTELAGPLTVNTMPESTIDATLEAEDIKGDTLSEAENDAAKVLSTLQDLGIDLPDVFEKLEAEGVEKFVAAWEDLLESMGARLQ
ncbi:transaldolase [Corynebacterium sp. ES2794-CONJ1]|uniref:transaldolase n=1 Tax=unclassified Corynebacterium TaxID=2624378 RepID=UPI002168BC21|nr:MULTISPECIES: transaldolase [unclassified Corynebacterium]MCS4489292.1 transaldolase [Corynebacterium sp. ES2775-CONJ]MCS4491105.1 transaldolase [Corynebacterium sp. ES2715-CONJ3]MCS4531014.1 transaldolase [Corynebacterium sp. ES2730-CONJ]MCU9518381.1 transaldolase [Corynebacterium sp. ES2794-CONJ1]